MGETKQCSKCGLVKDLADFYERGLRGRQCKACEKAACVVRAKADPEKANARVLAWRAKNKEKHAATTKKWRDANPESQRATYFWVNYRIPAIAVLLTAQGGLCAACAKPLGGHGRDPDSVCVDHNRKCCAGRRSCGNCVRGLIHRNCNLALGYAKDDLHVLRSAISYLEQWAANRGCAR